MKIIKNFFIGIKAFFKTMGLVEQAQVVASTALVVALITIITIRLVAGGSFSALDFISIITVGVFGYVSIFFSLRYGRILEAQRRELLELNTIAEAVNYSVDLNAVLLSALIKVMQLMSAESGWIYLQEKNLLNLKHVYGTHVNFFQDTFSISDEAKSWVLYPGVYTVDLPNIHAATTHEFLSGNIKSIASIPLVRQGVFAGVLVIGSKDNRKFTSKKIPVMQAFGNQISVALNNAYLFEQVRESERLYADLYENSPDMYHSVDRNGLVVSCNQTESRLLGMPKEAILGQHITTLYPDFQHNHVKKNLVKIFEQGKQLEGFEEQIQRTDGSLIDVSVNTSLVYDASGKPQIVRMVMRDITEKKKMEAKLLQAQKIDSIGNLAGGIAHDFNNILTAILGSASIMKRRIENNDRLLKYVDLIETTSRRGAAVTRQLLTFSRKNNPHIACVNVNTITDQTIKLFEVTTPRTIHIKCSLSPEPLFIEGDEGQIQQALLNLCLNSRDAMPNGGVLVINTRGVNLDEEQAKQATDGVPGHYVMLSVADSGAGISQSIINRIFEPFFTTKEQGKGTGLGLSVVYGVVKSHNGFLNVSSEVNSGTIFTIYLPRAIDKPSLREYSGDRSELVGGSERILLIEDEISVGEIGADILQELGYKIDIAHNGKEAMEKLGSTDLPYNMVILDMNMPRMGGRVTFDYIKQSYPTLKVLVCSGYSATMLDDGKFTEAIDGFIQKPYELDDMARRVRTILDSPPKNFADGK